MKTITGIVTALAAILISGTALRADPLATWNFQNDTVGAVPGDTGASAYRATTGTNAIAVVNASSTQADPFGGSGNQSLYVSSPSGGSSSTYPSAQFSLPSGSGALAAGTLTFNLNVVGTGITPGVIEIDLGALTTSANTQRANSLVALQIWTNSQTTQSGSPSPAGYSLGFSGGISGSSNLHPFNQQALVGATNTVSISWDATAGTYSVILNGVTVTQGSGSSIVSTFAATTAQAGVSGVRFTEANAADTSFFIDNISISSAAIPEPKHVALILGGVAGLGVCLVRKMKVRDTASR